MAEERDDTVLSAYVTNLGKYNEGRLVGEYLHFPTTQEEVQALLKRIGVDGVRYEETFITDYESSMSGLTKYLGEYESVDELNHLAHVLSELSPDELEKYEAALDLGHNTTVPDLINLAHNLDCFDLFPGVEDEDSLGRYLIEEMGALNVPDYLQNYIDYAAYGRDCWLNANGSFTEQGYIEETGGFREVYQGREDIPDEHRVFAYPQLSIREQMAAYQEVSGRAAEASEKQAPSAGRDDR